MAMARMALDQIDALCADDYVWAFQKADLSDSEIRLLLTHFRSGHYQSTVRRLAMEMGYCSWRATNVQYGNLAKRIAGKLGIRRQTWLNVLVEFEKPLNGDLLLTLRAPVVSALNRLQSSGNLFADLDLPNPEQELLKARLTLQIYKIAKDCGLTQAQVAEILGIKRPHVSALMRNRAGNLSIYRLMEFLTELGQDVRITVKPTRKTHGEMSVVMRVDSNTQNCQNGHTDR
jgi:predicted XRE-type DNA-binding protein